MPSQPPNQNPKWKALVPMTSPWQLLPHHKCVWDRWWWAVCLQSQIKLFMSIKNHKWALGPAFGADGADFARPISHPSLQKQVDHLWQQLFTHYHGWKCSLSLRFLVVSHKIIHDGIRVLVWSKDFVLFFSRKTELSVGGHWLGNSVISIWHDLGDSTFNGI